MFKVHVEGVVEPNAFGIEFELAFAKLEKIRIENKNTNDIDFNYEKNQKARIINRIGTFVSCTSYFSYFKHSLFINRFVISSIL